MSRKTVRKVIRSEATDFHFERRQQPMPRLGAWREVLDTLLVANVGKSSRERLTLIRLFETARGSGYEGGYDAVRRYARAWSRQRAATSADAFVPLSFAPGEAMPSGRLVVARPGRRAAPSYAPDARPITAAATRRWHHTVAELVVLQAEYEAWLATLPETLQDTVTAEALHTICDLDLTELQAVEPPRGFGRD